MEEQKETEIALGIEVRWRLIKGNDSKMAFMALGTFLIIPLSFSLTLMKDTQDGQLFTVVFS